MNYRQMGRTGLKLSEISLGAWVTFGDQIGEKMAASLIHKAYDQGVNFFDNADVYASGQAEVVMGQAIAGLPREELVISSKVYWRTMEGPNGRGLSRKHIMESCEASLRRLGSEYLDLYFCHRYDEETPLEEVVRAMDDLVHQGKVLYWGTSEWHAAQIANAHRIARQWNLYRPVVEQPQYNMIIREKLEDELRANARDLGFGLVTWSPLRFGLLSGKYNNGMPEEGTRLSRDKEWSEQILTEQNLEKTRQLAEVAQDLGVKLAQLAIAWPLRIREITSVITGASKVEHLEENLAATDVVAKLDEEVLARIDGILAGPSESPGS